jgi:hypothetical protein
MVEVAMTGTALPVLLNISPSYKFNFGECPVGEHADVLCTIKNESNVLPAIFQFRKIAHFLTHPPNGKIPPNQSQDVIFSFSPNQIGRSCSVIYKLISVLGGEAYCSKAHLHKQFRFVLKLQDFLFHVFVPIID